LVSEENLTYDKAVEILLSLGAAEHEVKHASITFVTLITPGNHHKIHLPDDPPAIIYGSTHKATATDECQLKEAECCFCHKKGHIMAQAFKSQVKTNQEESNSPIPEYSLFNQISINNGSGLAVSD